MKELDKAKLWVGVGFVIIMVIFLGAANLFA